VSRDAAGKEAARRKYRQNRSVPGWRSWRQLQRGGCRSVVGATGLVT